MKITRVSALTVGLVALCFVLYFFLSSIHALYYQDNDSALVELNISGLGGRFSDGKSSNIFSNLAASVQQQSKPDGSGGGGGGGFR